MPVPSLDSSTFLVEHYRPGLGVAELGHCLSGVRDEVQAPGDPGAAPRVLCSVIVPDDEAFLVLFRADSEPQVREAYLRAGLTFDRISTAIAGLSAGDHTTPHNPAGPAGKESS
jgi:hypothetical protein